MPESRRFDAGNELRGWAPAYREDSLDSPIVALAGCNVKEIGEVLHQFVLCDDLWHYEFSPTALELDRGRMCWLWWKTLSGSYVVFTSTSRS